MDIQLYYTEKGSGKPLLLLHGNGEDSGYFVHQIEAFSETYRVIAVDTRGHGRSPRGSAPFSIRQFAEDLSAFLEERAIDKAHILGFSDGGNIALTFALKYPEKVDRLILNGANLNPAGVKPAVQIPIVAGYRAASLFARISPAAAKNAEMLSLMVREPNVSPGELSGLSRKTLVIAGTKDMIRGEHTRLIYESLPDAKLVLLPGSHFIAQDNPEAFNRAVIEFLAE